MSKKKSIKKVPVKKSAPVVKKSVAVAKKSPAANVAKPVVPVVTTPAKSVTPVKPVSGKPNTPAALPIVLKKRTLYVEVSPDKYFVLCDGRKVKSGKELADILQVISDDMFKYHVTDTKNDFSNWINDVFGEPDLSKKIRTVRNRLETSVELYRYMFDKLDKIPKK